MWGKKPGQSLKALTDSNWVQQGYNKSDTSASMECINEKGSRYVG